MKFCSNHTGIKDNIKISKKVRVKKFLFKKWKQRYSAKIILNRTEIKIIKTRLTKKKKKRKFISRGNCNRRTFARNEAKREEETLVCKTSHPSEDTNDTRNRV